MQMHFGVNTAEHDLQVKLKKAREFVDKGHKVKCSIKFKYTRDAQDAQQALPALQERMAEFAEVVLPPPTERQIRGSFSFYISPTQAPNKQQDVSA